MSKEIGNPDKTKRRFSKKLVLWNNGLAWLLLFAAIPFNQVSVVIGLVFPFIIMLIGIYTGVGHMDYRKMLDATKSANQLDEEV